MIYFFSNSTYNKKNNAVTKMNSTTRCTRNYDSMYSRTSTYNRNLGIDLPKLYVLEYYIWTFKLLQNFTEFKFFTISFLQFGTESFRVT